MAYTTFWLIVCGACLIIEVFTVGFLLFFPGVGAFFSFLAALLGASFLAQVIIFTVSTVFMIFFARPMMAKLFKSKDTAPMHSDSLIGKTGMVLKPITGVTPVGQVKVAGEIWSAISLTKETIYPDTKIIVKEVKGVKLVVEAK